MAEMPDIKKTVDLNEMIETIPWSAFESNDLGDVFVYQIFDNHAKGAKLIRFSLRVGIHMGRVSKAILAEKQFVRITLAPEWATMQQYLSKLDPEYQDGCLYPEVNYHVNMDTLSHGKKHWKPQIPYQNPNVLGGYGSGYGNALGPSQNVTWTNQTVTLPSSHQTQGVGSFTYQYPYQVIAGPYQDWAQAGTDGGHWWGSPMLGAQMTPVQVTTSEDQGTTTLKGLLKWAGLGW